MKKTLLLYCILFLVGFNKVSAQDFSNKGTDFWLGYGYHVGMSNNALGNAANGGAQEMVLYFTSDKNAIVTVDIPGVGYSQTYNVIANQVTVSNPIPKTGVQDARINGVGLLNKGIHVTSDVPIVAYQHIYNSAVSGATLLFPTNTLGKEYYSVNYTQSSNQAFSNSFFFVIATEDGTSIEITPSAANLNGLAVGVPSTPIPLTKGQVYSVMGTTAGSQGTDLTGSKIRSISSNGSGGCKKIAVFSGAGKISIGGTATGSADNLIGQALPSVAWGKKYLTAPTGSQPNNFYRVCVTDPNTVVTLNGVVIPKTSLINNFYYQFKNSNGAAPNSPAPNLIEADIPIMVAQYCTTQGQDGNPNSSPFGDPEMIYLSPVEQTINNITLYSANRFAIVQSYINVIIKTGGVNSFTIDGISKTASFNIHPQESSFSYAIIPVTSGSHTLYSDSGFNAIAYGFGSAESYGYNAGTNVKDFSQTASFQNPYKRLDSAISCVNTPFEFSIPLNFQPSTIKWEFTAAPNISPTNTIGIITTPTSDSVINTNGQKLYYYSPKQTFRFSQANTPALRDTIKLYTTSATPDGCGSTEQLYTIPVKVVGLPLADFTTNNSGCVSDSVHFFDATNTFGNGVIDIGIWDFGDGTIDTSFNPIKKYALGKSYNIRYRPISIYGCIGDTTIIKTYSALPLANFTFNDSCANQQIVFTDASTTATGTIVKWYWDYGNGVKDTLTTNTTRTITYPTHGAITVSLMVESNTGCKSLAFSKNITIRPIPEVGFRLPEVCQNDAVTQFFDTTKIADNSNSFNYLWNFNAGTPAVTPVPVPITGTESTAMNPKVRYSTPAYYKVSVLVTSIYGCKVALTQDFTVNGSNPNPDFEVVNPSNLCSNTQVAIRNKSAMLDFGNVTRLEIFWDITDLTKKTIVEDPGFDSLYKYTYPNFQSPATKNYTIRLVAYSGSSASSCNKKLEKTITVLQSPMVSFSKSPSICLDAAPRLFTEASYINTVPNATGSPSFSGIGISNASTGEFNPALTGAGGPFTIKYLSISDKGCRDSATQTITVWPSPTAKWGVQTILCEKNDIQFTDSSVANYSNIIHRNWSFGDGVSIDKLSTTKFNYQYPTAKNYTIGLRVVTDSGCISALNEQVIKVNYLPRVNFTAPTVVCLPDGNATFTNTSSIPDASQDLFSYQWNFGDTNNPTASTLKDGKHQFFVLGSYQVKQQITTKDACIDSSVQSFVNVFPQPKAAFTTTPTEICLNETIQFTDNSLGLTSAISTWVWDLGGTKATQQNPSKKFTDSGSFNIKLYAFNVQGCVSDTLTKSVVVHPFPHLDLGPDLVVLEGGQIILKPKFIFGNNLSYLWKPATYLNSDTAAVPISIPKDSITYQLVLTGIGSCSVTDQIFIKVLFAPEVPNAFSPNGDGINDTWHILYLESYPGATIDVFNRYGQKVFSSQGYTTEWKGDYNGNPLPIGTYYYIINPKNGRSLINGSVTIIK